MPSKRKRRQYAQPRHTRKQQTDVTGSRREAGHASVATSTEHTEATTRSHKAGEQTAASSTEHTSHNEAGMQGVADTLAAASGSQGGVLRM